MSGEVIAVDHKSLATKIAERVREDSRLTGKLTSMEVFYERPYSLKPEETEDVLRLLIEAEEHKDINILRDTDAGKVYFYASPYICEAYAKNLLLAERNNPYVLIAETVREESRMYPRPTCSMLFQLPPYELNLDDLPFFLEEIRKREDMQDIKWFKASTDVLYLYSERYMSLEHAKGLAEWVEVEQFENQ
ncbi:MAG: hypothetical protein ACOY9Y_04440 [Bacillota bacterium]